MFRNQYDTDPTTFSPQGRLFQVEYAAEAVKQGSCCVGIKSKTHAVLGVLKRSPDELASYQEKLFKIRFRGPSGAPATGNNPEKLLKIRFRGPSGAPVRVNNQEKLLKIRFRGPVGPPPQEITPKSY